MNYYKVRTYLILSVLMAAPALYGLYRILFFSYPLLKERWLFYFFTFLAVCGIGLPVFAFLHRYFFANRRINPLAVVYEAIFLAALVDVLFWFQIGRILSTTIVVVCVGCFLVLEAFLYVRELIDFRPEMDKGE